MYGNGSLPVRPTSSTSGHDDCEKLVLPLMRLRVIVPT